MKINYLPALLLFIPLGATQHIPNPSTPIISNIPGTVSNSTSNVQFTYSGSGFDGPKVAPLNSTTVDWWYFDGVSSDHKSAFVINFLMQASLLDGVHPLFVSITASFPNGTSYTSGSLASSAVVTTYQEGTSGEFVGAGANWTGAPDMSRYIITVNSPEMGIKGKMTLESVAKAHCPCGPLQSGQSLELGPHIGWANSVPDAISTVDFTIQGSPLTFTGTGYHDKNWSDVPFFSAINGWYWGHGRLGPYSIVFFNLISSNGVSTASGYVSRDNQILSVTCGDMVVRPVGQNDTYPPTATSGTASGLNITIELKEGKLFAEVKNEKEIFADAGYTRWIGSITGTLKGAKLDEGVALYELVNSLVGVK